MSTRSFARRWLLLGLAALGVVACVPSSPSRAARLAAGEGGNELNKLQKTAETPATSPSDATAPLETPSKLILGNALELPAAIPDAATSASPSASPSATLEQLALVVARGDYDQASRFLKFAPSSAVGSLLDALIARQEDDHDAALQALRRTRELEPSLAELLTPLEQESAYRASDALTRLDELRRSRDFDLLLHIGQRLLESDRSADSRRFVTRAAQMARGVEQQGHTRLLRAKMELARDRPFAALNDLRWLAVKHPTHASAKEATHLIETRFPRHPLRPADRRARARHFAEAGDVANLELELQVLRELQPPPLSETQQLSLRGNASYAARQFALAAPILERAAQLAGTAGKDDWYYAGRAYARAGHPERAIECFQKVHEHAANTGLARLAAFHIARQRSTLGQWQEAVDSYSSFLRRYPTNTYTRRAQIERAIAWLALGDDTNAAQWFERLRKRSPKSNESQLIQVLEALARARLGELEPAANLLTAVAETSPLSFAGLAARQRLLAMGQTATHPALQRSAALPSPPLLPKAAIELDLAGFSEFSQELMRAQEGQWQDGARRCQAYSQLTAGRRRYLWGYREATRSGFFSDPLGQPDWQWQCLYPTPYRQWVEKYGRQYAVPSSMVYAVMRQESGFRAAVRSPAGAMGLMQIIDPTARRLVEELDLDYHPQKLEHPAYNIQLGTYYLSRLFEYFTHPALVAAAYNAGPDAAARWSAAAASLPLEAFVLRIPFDETRNYVQRVLANLETYEQVYPELPRLEWPLSLGPQYTALVPAPARPLVAPDHLY